MSLRYVLVSAVRNEAKHIQKTLDSVIHQSVLPDRWVIVSDQSTDETEGIVRRYTVNHSWIQLVRHTQDGERNFARKVYCFRAGCEQLDDVDYDIIGNLDGDVSFQPDYMEYLLGKFDADPRLGMAGTPYTEGDLHSFRDSYVDPRHVHGQIQMFRRQCFEEIGGYVPVPTGGIDSIAVASARMHGWTTGSFQGMTFEHHRKMGQANAGRFAARFRAGKKEYYFGNHLLWELVRCLFQAAKNPYIVGGLCIFAGYASCVLRREKRPTPPELVAFVRKEQMERLLRLLRGARRGRN